MWSVISVSQTVNLCPNSITSVLLKTCLKPGFRQVLSRKKSETWSPRQDRSISTCRDRSSGKFSTNKKVGDLVTDKFWAEKSRRPGLWLVCDLVSDKSYDKSYDLYDLSYDKSYDKIDLMEFGLYHAGPHHQGCFILLFPPTSTTSTSLGRTRRQTAACFSIGSFLVDYCNSSLAGLPAIALHHFRGCWTWLPATLPIHVHHQSGYTDISYVGPVTLPTASPSTSPGHGRGWAIVHSRSLVHAPGTHFLLTFVVHPAWTLLRSVSNKK